MRIALCLALAACLAACQTVPTAPTVSEGALVLAELASVPEADRIEVGIAVATEIGARFRCPTGPLESAVFAGLRLTFDTRARPLILPESAAVVDRLRLATNAVCGISPG